ncbi:MAG: hypothetical protein JW844_07605 [Candidatus Omnitrophica bacterium]|nr:hypothetical protein [Candidatus Omnitrophota bacterium]
MKQRICGAVFLCAFFLSLSARAWAFQLSDDFPEIHGFLEGAGGLKFKDGTTKHDDYNLLEARLQLRGRYYPRDFLNRWTPEINVKGDFLLDGYFGGATDVSLRELNALITPAHFMDIKLGRQVFTWGTGDYLFVNDVFPKDYVSFLIGRDDEYLKAPSDGVRISLYNKMANLEVIAIPFFEPNVIPTGERLSFFDSFQQGIAGRESERVLIEPPRQPSNTEYALRAYRTFGSYEAALYGFYGFYKMPRGYKNEALRQLYYPGLSVYGASVRGPVAGGIGSLEAGYYDSREDRKGDDRLIENPSFKALCGYERDLGNDLRVGVQYQYEQILNYTEYQAALLAGDFFWDEYRHLITARLTKLLLRQTLHLSLFSFYSPSDHEVYLRPSATYDIKDNVELSIGANLIWGDEDKTEFGQFEENTNVYMRVRISF